MIASSLDDAIEPRCHHDMIALTAADYLKSAVVRGVEVVIIIVIRGSVFRYHSCHSRFSFHHLLIYLNILEVELTKLIAE